MWSSKRRAALSAAAVAAWAAISPATLAVRAATVPWTNAGGGNFNDIANWNSGAGPVPGIADDAQFTLASTYTTTLDLDPATSGLTLTAGDVTFVGDATPRTYNAVNVNLNAGTLRLGASPTAITLNYTNFLNVKGGASLVVSGGNDVTTSGSAINLATVNGGAPGAVGSITVDGTGSSFVANNSSFIGGANCVGSLTFSNNASGAFQSIFGTTSSSLFSGAHLTVTSGADLTVAGTAGYVQFGTSTGHASQQHSITVSGAGSTFTQSNGFFTVGGGLGTTTFTIADGGTVTTAGGGYALAVHANATMDLTGGTLNARGQLQVGGANAIFQRTAASGTINWPDGFKGFAVSAGGKVDWAGALTLSAAGSANFVNTTVGGANARFITGGALTVADRVTMSLTSGGQLAPASLIIEPAATGTSPPSVSIDGTGSSLVTGAAQLGGANKSAMLSFSNNATGTFAGTIAVLGGAQSGVNVASGAHLVTTDIAVGPTAFGPALFSMGDAGTTVTQSGGAGVTVGQNALLSVRSSSVLTTGTGGLTLVNGGRVNAEGGTINVNGDISVSGGNGITGGTINWASGRTMTIAAGTVSSVADMPSLSGNTILVGGATARLNVRDVGLVGGTIASFTGGGDGVFRTLNLAADGSHASVTVDGSGSQLLLTSTSLTSTIGAAMGTFAELQVLNDATFNAFDGSTLVVKGSGTVNVAASSNVRLSTLTLDAGEFTIGSGAVSVGAGLTTPNGGQMTIQEGGKLIVRGGNVGSADANGMYDGVTGLIQSGRSGGDWAGAGITTAETEAEEGLTSLAVATADAGGTFGGVSVASGDVLVMYTYAGDANLDGFISGDDYSAIDFSISLPGAFGWSNGDFNYDGIISGDDYATIDFNIVAQGAPFSTGAAAAAKPQAVVAVPEPMITGPAGIALLLVTRRRRPRAALPD